MNSARRAPFAALLAAAALACRPLAADAQTRPPSPESHEVHTVRVIPVNVAGHAPVVVDRDQIAQALFGSGDSVATRYRALSYGKVAFTGSVADVAPAVKVDEPEKLCGAGLDRLSSDAEEAARRGGFLSGAYTHVVFILPADWPCDWNGLGDIGGHRVYVKATTAKLFRHELGHNLGMNHAVNWRDPSAESSDLMGSGDGMLNAPHVVEMGWLKAFAGKVVEVERGGELTVEPLEADPRRSAMAKVAVVRPSAEGNVYYLSYRAPRPGDTLAPEFTQGLTIHTGDPSRRGGALTYFVIGLTDGAEFRDGPLVVRQVSHNDGVGVTFRVAFDGTGPLTPAGPPPAPAGTVQSLGSGKCLDLPGGRGDDGTSPIQYSCHGRQNQQWSVEGSAGSGYRIVSKLSGKCLALGVASGPSGKSIVETPCGSSPTELWDLHATRGGSTVQSRGTSLCLDVPGRSATNGARPIVWPCNGGINQAWRVEAARPR